MKRCNCISRELVDELLAEIDSAKNLEEVAGSHRHMYELDLRCKNLDPCSYGMFRCENIFVMTLDEIYLGGIYGIWTHPASYWNTCSDTIDIGEKKDILIKDVVMWQYKNMLKSNLIAMYEASLIRPKNFLQKIFKL